MNPTSAPSGRAPVGVPLPRGTDRPRATGRRGLVLPGFGRRAAGRRSAGQGLVEFALIVPVMLMLLLGMLEFGFAFDAHLNLEYASREGARTAASLADGATGVPCDTSVGVDAHIVAAVERVLSSQGSPLSVNKVQEIRIFKATSTGGETAGLVNIWTYTPTAGRRSTAPRSISRRARSIGRRACATTDRPPIRSASASTTRTTCGPRDGIWSRWRDASDCPTRPSWR